MGVKGWDGHLACEVFLYVDNGQATGLGWEGAMDGFRRLPIRWWRQNVLRTYPGVDRAAILGVALLPRAKRCIAFVSKNANHPPHY